MSANKRKIGALVAGLGIAGVFCYKIVQQYKLSKTDEDEFKEEQDFDEETVSIKMNVNDIIDDKAENDSDSDLFNSVESDVSQLMEQIENNNENEHSLKEESSLEDDIEKQINMQKEENDSKKK